MVYWNRFISYIYRYHNGNKCENAGFAKVSKNGRTGKLTIGLKNGMNSKEELYGVYIYRETLPENDVDASDGGAQMVVPIPVSIGKLRLKGGHGEEVFSFEWDDVAGSKRPLAAFAGIALRRLGDVQGQCEDYYECDMFCSSWTDSKVDYSHMWDMKETNAIQDGAVTGDLAESEAVLTRNEPLPEAGTAAAVAAMLEGYDRLPLLPVSEEDPPSKGIVESVKITPNDIGLLDMCNWKLGVNSFLTHGFYSYKYLMLGRVTFAPDGAASAYILGVPGIYSSREKYLAGIFGFDRFIPEKETQIKTGSFGYWIVDIR